MGLFSKLQNGGTPLKTIPFGKDRPGGGSSGQPYIKTPFPTSPIPDVPDFLWRGGLNAPIDATEDVLRLTKYMLDYRSPKGFLFINKMNLLSRTSVATEASISAGYANSPSKELAWTKAPINQGIYTPLSTLLQAKDGYLGVHLNTFGINPLSPLAGVIEGKFLPGVSIVRYEDVVRGETRLTKTVKEENWIYPSVPSYAYDPKNYKPTKVVTTKKVPVGDYENRLIYLYEKDMIVTKNAGGNILEYSGGPGSILGVGKTRIGFADQRTGMNHPLSTKQPVYFALGGVKLHEDDFTPNYIKLTKASVVFGLTKDEIGLSPDGKSFYSGRYFGPSSTSPSGSNFTLGFYKPFNLPLLGSNGYQVGDINKKTTESDAVYIFPIEDILSSYNRQLLSPIEFDGGPGNSNTWVATSQDKPLPEYSSVNTLTADYPNSGSIWIELNNKSKTHKDGYLANLDKNAGSWEVNGILQQNNNNAYPGGIAPDFRKVPREKRGLYKLPITAWNDDFSSNDGETFSEYFNNAGKLKKDTLQRIYYRNNASSFATERNPFSNSADDLITFRFGIINPGSPSNIKKLTFRAYINSFSDGYQASWKDQTYMGRGEKFHKYDSFSRDISLAFTVVSHNRDYLDDMYSHLNTLAASLSPTYTKFGYMAGNLHTLTVGNYIADQPGIMTSLDYDITEDSSWGIDSGNQLPYLIDVNCKFTPIHTFRPEMVWEGKQHAYIGQSTTANSSNQPSNRSDQSSTQTNNPTGSNPNTQNQTTNSQVPRSVPSF